MRRPDSIRADASDDAGFSLIEALVALAILAIASVGLIRTVESHIDSTRGMEQRATAMWVAQNRMAELQIGDPAARADSVEMLGRQWRVETRQAATSDPSIARVRVEVFASGGDAPMATLDGFLDTGAAT
ncbi:type II secretion system minor pseudopilin GspI [Sphingomonadaceae bacterium LXI357]|uniref:Type II secretion system protein I n=2 Tax=Stakelama marina TaxID=2826939 RepID=A0A8T4IA63_9SPHN|nr:type II secretion system minor pseudopilin GspI [Stakelama marina]